jgi:hypothetical protein
MSNECLTCGLKEISNTNEYYFVNPGMVIVPCSYLLCEDHKNLRYCFDDIYEINGNEIKRKDIDHGKVKLRSFAGQELAKEIHNITARKNIEKFIKTGKILDENGKEIDIGSSVNYELSKS